MVTEEPVRFIAVMEKVEEALVLIQTFPKERVLGVVDKVGIAACVVKSQTGQPLAVEPGFFGTICQKYCVLGLNALDGE